jgi:hypothetical protein
MHRIVGLDHSTGSVQSTPRSHQRVRAVWAPERKGQILEIPHFELVPGEPAQVRDS